MDLHRALVLLVLGVSPLMTSSAALDAPKNVRLTSFNMNLQLQWDPPVGGAADLLYSTQFWPRGRPLHVKPGCVNTSLLHCDLSSVAALVSEFASYAGSVQARRGDETSSWTNSNNITLFKDTVIGPPGLTLLSSGASLEVVIADPEFSVSSLRTTFPDATYNLSYWREGHQQVQIVDDVRQTRLILNELQPWSRYCIKVHIQTVLAGASRPSRTVCESTRSEEAAPWVAVVVTAVVMVVLVALLVVGVRHRKRISHFLCLNEVIPEHCKQDLLTPLSSLVTCNSPSLEVYDTISIVAEQPTEEQRPLEAACSDGSIATT